MKITLAAICDYASITEGGKLNVLGVFDGITSENFPSAHPSLWVVVRLQLTYADREKTYRIPLRLEDQDGVRLVDAAGEITVGKIPPGEEGAHNMILNLVGLRFPRPGKYLFVIGQTPAQEYRLPLTLKLASQ